MAANTTELPQSYIDAYSGTQVYIATSVVLCVTTILLSLRLYARSLTDANRGWDEFLLIPAWIFLLALSILLYLAVPRAGIGRHLEVVLQESPQKLETWNLVIYMLDWFYLPTNMLSRISVVTLYLRIFTSRLARLFCWLVIAFVIGICISFLVSAQFQCIPYRFIWDKSLTGHCFNISLWWKLSNPPNIIADVAILLLPMQTIWNLRATVYKKVGIGFVCLTGSVGLFASCMRTAQFFSTLALNPPDPTWTSAPLLVWTVVEPGMYFSAACLVCLRPLYGRLPKFIRDRWTVAETGGSNPTRSGARSALRQGGRPLDYSEWETSRKRSSDANSRERIVDPEAGSDGMQMEDIRNPGQKGWTEPNDWGTINVNTTLEVSSIAAEREEYKYTPPPPPVKSL